jgi:4-hydroxy-3-polyprenylbenzoate decarboxylase
VEKNKKDHIKKLHEAICELRLIEGIKMILYVEHTVDVNDLPVALWRFCNNLDPKRDHFIVKKQILQNPDQYFACIGFDGTLKTKDMDGFYRDWPNIIIADDKTIASVDEKWPRVGLGEFIPSPSLKYKAQMYGEEAVARFEG